MPPADNLMEKLVSLAKRRGFVFQSSEIYGGLGSVWDYGPLGVELKKNIKERWWRSMVHDREDIEGLDAAILMHPKVRSEEHTSELQSRSDLVCRLLLEKKKPYDQYHETRHAKHWDSPKTPLIGRQPTWECQKRKTHHQHEPVALHSSNAQEQSLYAIS